MAADVAFGAGFAVFFAFAFETRAIGMARAGPLLEGAAEAGSEEADPTLELVRVSEHPDTAKETLATSSTSAARRSTDR